MKKVLLMFALTVVVCSVMAQEVLSLGQCIRIGLDNNLSLKSTQNDVEKGQLNISENRARLLPQINI